MQTYGVPPDVQQFVVGRGSGAHMFSISPHEVSLSPAQHGHHSQQQQQQQQHPAVAAAAAAAAHHHQQQQQLHHHQSSTVASASQHQSLQHQQLQLHPPHHQPQPQQQPHLQTHQQVVQQLGLSPDSPEAPSPIASRPSPTAYRQLSTARDSIGDEEPAEDHERGIAGNRWPRQETLALIKLRTEMDASFRDSGLKAPLWEEVSRRLAELGFHRSAKKCKEKFENVHKYYKKTKGGKAGRQDGKSYRFFAQLEALYGPNSTGAGGGPTTVGAGNLHGDASNGTFLLSSGVATNGGNHGASSGQRFSENSDGANLSSGSSEEEYDEPDGDDNKRKRKGWTSQMAFFENLVRRFMDKQEAMHKKFLEAIDRREQERLVKEEAWKKQELSRIHREQELRSQERSLAATRDAALVSFLQKITGQTVQLPQVLASHPVSRQPEFQEEQQQEKEPFDANSKRWPKQEVQALIRLRSGMESRFQEPGPKGPLWEEISTSMGHMGYNRSAKRCKEKWENINKYFRKTKDTAKKRPESSKTCPYFQELDMLYRTGVLTAPNSRTLNDHNDLLDRPARATGEDSGQAREMLAIMPQGESGPSGGSASNGTPAQFFSSPEVGDQNSQKVNEKPNLTSDTSNGKHAACVGLNFDGLHGGATFSGSNKPSLKMGNLVEEILDQQNEQQAADRGRSSQEWQQQREKSSSRVSQERGSRPSPSPRDAALIALVHKLTGQAPADMPVASAASNSEQC